MCDNPESAKSKKSGVTGFCEADAVCKPRDGAVTALMEACSVSTTKDTCLAVDLPEHGGQVCFWKAELEATMSDCVIQRNLDSNLFIDLTVLMVTIFLFVSSLMANRWTMTNSLGRNLIIIYVLYIALQGIQQFALKGCSDTSCCDDGEYFCHVHSSCVSDCAENGSDGCLQNFFTNPDEATVGGVAQYCKLAGEE